MTETTICRPDAALMTIKDVAQLLNCSTRTVYRLNDAGRMPRPVRLGSLVRWNRSDVEQWIADGCPAPAPGRCVAKGGLR